MYNLLTEITGLPTWHEFMVGTGSKATVYLIWLIITVLQCFKSVLWGNISGCKGEIHLIWFKEFCGLQWIFYSFSYLSLDGVCYTSNQHNSNFLFLLVVINDAELKRNLH